MFLVLTQLATQRFVAYVPQKVGPLFFFLYIIDFAIISSSLIYHLLVQDTSTVFYFSSFTLVTLKKISLSGKINCRMDAMRQRLSI